MMTLGQLADVTDRAGRAMNTRRELTSRCVAARYYDTNGHFTQADPVPGNITRPEKYNPYTYTAGDPTNNTDLSGRDSVGGECVKGAVDGLVVGAATGADETGVGTLVVASVGCAFAVTEYDEGGVRKPVRSVVCSRD